MKANPGGKIDLDSVVGRSQIIDQIWDEIERQSIRINAERRIGKTTVILVLEHRPRQGWVPIFNDLEDCHSAMDFAQSVYRDVYRFLSLKGKGLRRVSELIKGLGGTEIAGTLKFPQRRDLPWKELLTRSIEDLVNEREDAGEKLLFLWDEVPFMLANIRDREGEHVAMEVLDTLRSLRQSHPAFRMIITGSIGLHHVLTSLKDKNYANAPVNDMVQIEIKPLARSDAKELAIRLIKGEAIESKDLAAAAESIARQADDFPFYIHHIVRALRSARASAEPETVAQIVASHLVDANDPWELRHYSERIGIYYQDNSPAAMAVLDELAAGRDRATVNELLSLLKGTIGRFDDREKLLRLLDLLERDHYLIRHTDGTLAFRFPLIRRWWKLYRGL